MEMEGKEGKLPVITVEDVGKIYRLGRIGGTTLQAQLQSWWALKRGKSDPNLRIGQEELKEKEFCALQHINFCIYEGERVGIIGRNGAGKSTLLKLISRITAPAEGRICIRGRISSMLEVGTGFHGELTGRENVYLNGAILGMKEREVDSKIEEIIEFSECEQFIDTPVKRYSSGMYVKLAFAVAAFLNADIFLMDEVLAVGDMMFQKKCLRKMREISEDEAKTILYVSHNMQTIRELCDRCIVLEAGRVIHDGSVDEGIRLYMKDVLEVKTLYEFPGQRTHKYDTGIVKVLKIEVENPVLGNEERFLNMKIYFRAQREIRGLHIRFTVHNSEDVVTGTGISRAFRAESGVEQCISLIFDTESLVGGEYSADMVFVEPYGSGQTRHALLQRALAFRIEKRDRLYHVDWSGKYWGDVRFPDLQVMEY